MTSGFGILPAGSAAVLIECGDLEHALQAFASLAAARERGELDVAELVPAAETVLVAGGEARDPRALRAKLRRLLAASESADSLVASVTETVIPVYYQGEDLDEVAALTGMSAAQLVERHTSASYTVAFTGFAPGFAYLSGGDPLLEVPRRATPRPRILSGSVGLAGPFSAVYPRESPGGWQIIGHTVHRMWDLAREQPATLVAGESVRFIAERESVRAGAGAHTDPANTTVPSIEGAIDPGSANSASTSNTANTADSPTLRVIDPGLQTLVEDNGRPGAAGIGVGVSGTSVARAYRQANRLVGNQLGAAALELSHGGFTVEAIGTAVLAFTGAPRDARITGPFGSRIAPAGQAFRLSVGERLTLSAPAQGLRTVLALRGGVAETPVLGSRSRDTLAALGPEPLRAGDVIGVENAGVLPVAAPEASSPVFPATGQETPLRVVLGPRDNWFDAASITRFSEQSWEVSPRSDRVGARLTGIPLTRADGFELRELASEGTVLGAIQIPPDGQPVLFLADRPLTGGYPVLAVVHADDLELAAQLAPGCRVRFVPVANTEPPHLVQPPHALQPATTQKDRS